MFGTIRQLGFVFKNIDEKIKQFEELFGVSFNRFEEKIKKNIYKEKIEPYKLSFGFTMIGDIQLEFIQPLEGETIYNSYLEERGEGFHHVGIYTDEFEKMIEELESKGFKQLTNGIVAGQKFAYFDTLDKLGLIIELLAMPKKK
ncbi:MAG: VOC family protein [Candidatus Helarchaeota archaeon]